MKTASRLLAWCAGMAVVAAGTVAATSMGAGALPTKAMADAPALTPATVSQDQLPTTQINGIAWAQVTVGNTVYVVGAFTKARPAGSAPGQNEVTRTNILAYDIRTGVLNTSFVHSLNAQGQTIAASPDGSRIYVGGQFDRVDGQVRQRIAAFSTATGQLLPFAPKPDAAVQTIAVTGSTVYMGGGFGVVNNVARKRLAAVDLSGNLRPWAPSASNVVSAMVVSPDGSKVFVGGKFTDINGSPNWGLSAVDPTSGAVIPTEVSQKIYAANNTSKAGIFSLRTDGRYIYTTGFNAYSGVFPQFEGSAAFDQSGNVVWVNDCWGDSYDATPVNGALYVASHNHGCPGPQTIPTGPPHYYGLAYSLGATQEYNVVDKRGWDYSAFHTAQLYSWTPGFGPGTVTGQSVWAFTGNADYVAAAGEFPKVNQVPQQGLVRFAVHSLAPNAWGPSGMGTVSSAVIGAGSSSRVQITVTGLAFDADDTTLRYTLVRNGDTSRPVDAQIVLTPGFWKKGSGLVKLADFSPPRGGSATYQVIATDSGGRRTSSAAITVSVPAAQQAARTPAAQPSATTSPGTPSPTSSATPTTTP